MGDPIFLFTNTADFQQTARELMLRTKYKTIPEFLKWRAAIITRDLVAFTPPRAGKVKDEATGESQDMNVHASGRTNWPAQKKAGESRVKSDISYLFPDLTLAYVVQHPFEGLVRWAKYMKGYIESKNLSALNKMLNDAGVKIPLVLMEATQTAHQGARGERGRVKRGVRYPVLDGKSVKRLIDVVKKDVGKLKAGWMRSVVKLGVKGIPVWVSRHTSAPGQCIDDSYSSPNPSITVINGAPHARDFDPNDIVGGAIRINEHKMRVELEKKLAWEFKKASAH